jgi:acyl-CoA thioester hydrolase
MIKSENKITVRYDEVDKMGYVYYGNYAKYYHIGRTELLRKIGIDETELENNKIILPVSEMHIKYIKPLFYDELILIRTTLKEYSRCILKFHCEILNMKNELVNESDIMLVFVNEYTRKPIRLPTVIFNKIESYQFGKE